jgi:probable rRNA maturation factor
MPAAVTNRQHTVALSPARLARTAELALAALGRPAGDVDVLVVDDAAITRLNGHHRGVVRRTDVLAFPLEAPGVATPLVGQIVISAETARRQARRLRVPLATELDLLVTHGVLHLVGYDDRDPVEAGLMHEREREILSAGRRHLPAQLWRGLLDAPPPDSALRRGPRYRKLIAKRQGLTARPPLQPSRVASVSGHPRSKPASRTPLQ